MRTADPDNLERDARLLHETEKASFSDHYGYVPAPFEELIKVLSKPFEDQPEFADYANPPAAHEVVCQTFCGT